MTGGALLRFETETAIGLKMKVGTLVKCDLPEFYGYPEGAEWFVLESHPNYRHPGRWCVKLELLKERP